MLLILKLRNNDFKIALKDINKFIYFFAIMDFLLLKLIVFQTENCIFYKLIYLFIFSFSFVVYLILF